jgi:2-dehydro-3-deoxy-D-gluconate 5-dehydrogenase
MKLFDLSGRVAIVTGGNGGIGLGMAKELAAAGAAVVIAARSRDKSAAAVAELTALGASALAVEADVSGQASCQAMVQTLSIGSTGSISWSTTPAPTSAGSPRSTRSKSGA